MLVEVWVDLSCLKIVVWPLEGTGNDLVGCFDGTLRGTRWRLRDSTYVVVRWVILSENQSSNSLYFPKFNIPPEPEAILSTGERGGMSPSQSAAAPLRRVTTSPTWGRDSILPSQQRRVNSHRESENPMTKAFSGLSGRLP